MKQIGPTAARCSLAFARSPCTTYASLHRLILDCMALENIESGRCGLPGDQQMSTVANDPGNQWSKPLHKHVKGLRIAAKPCLEDVGRLTELNLRYLLSQ